MVNLWEFYIHWRKIHSWTKLSNNCFSHPPPPHNNKKKLNSQPLPKKKPKHLKPWEFHPKGPRYPPNPQPIPQPSPHRLPLRETPTELSSSMEELMTGLHLFFCCFACVSPWRNQPRNNKKRGPFVSLGSCFSGISVTQMYSGNVQENVVLTFESTGFAGFFWGRVSTIYSLMLVILSKMDDNTHSHK